MSDSVSVSKVVQPREFLRRLKLEDLFLAPYLLAVVWPYFWAVPNRTMGWAIAAAVALAAWWVYVLVKPAEATRLSNSFWLIVLPPLLLVYTTRVLSPDVSYDVLNYHLFHAERALRGPLLIPGDFFPTPAPFNPAPDILTGFYRLLLGYRLGTLINLVSVIWLGIIVDRLLSKSVRRAWLRSAFVLLVLCTEQIFFQINNYMVDLLTLPLLLEAARLSVQRPRVGEEARQLITVSVLLGISVTFKLANLAFAFPIIAVCLFNLIQVRNQFSLRRLWQASAIALVTAVAPLIPFSILLYRHTQSPVFPLYNGVFKSPFWGASNVFDPRWGPKSITETLVWPVLVFFKPERFCEFPVYSGRIGAAFVVAALGLVVARRTAELRRLSVITLAAALLWSAASGYSRYAIFVELTGGVILIWLTVYLYQKLAVMPPVRWLSVACAAVLLLGQVTLSLIYAHRYEWSMRPTLLTMPQNTRDVAYVLRDRDLKSFLADEDRRLMESINMWVVSAVKTTAFMGLLRPEVPAINAVQWEYFSTSTSRRQFNEATKLIDARQTYSLCFPEDFRHSREALEARGLVIQSVRSINVPYFSPNYPISLYLLEVGRGAPTYSAEISVAPMSLYFAPGEQRILKLRVKNRGQMTWRARGNPDGTQQVNAGDRWLGIDGETVVNDLDGRVSLPRDINPGEEVELSLSVTAPRIAGQYILEIDMVHEGITFFSEKGSDTLRLNVQVRP